MCRNLNPTILQSKTTAKIIKTLNELYNDPNDLITRSNTKSIIKQWKHAVNNKKKPNYKGHYGISK